jgi:hypothetical protein
MAHTDAIGTAMKMLGLASDVYMGYGWKYDREEPSTTISDKPFITKTSIDELVKHLQEWVIVCSSADEAIQVARKKYKVAKWAEDEIKEKTKSIFI